MLMFIYKVKKSEDQRLQQQRDLDIKADALKCWTEDYVNNLPSQGNKTARERDWHNIGSEAEINKAAGVTGHYVESN